MSSGRLVPAVVLDRYEAHKAMERLRGREGPLLRGLHDKLFVTWQLKGANNVITVPLTKKELEAMRRLGATSSPQVVEYRWFAIYRRKNGVIYTKTTSKPPKKKTLRVQGEGRKSFTLYKLYQLPNGSKESEAFMARKKKQVEEEIDELEGLEELEDEDVEEPEVEEDEEEVEEKPKRRSRTRAKAPAKSTRTRRTKKVEEPEEEDEDDEEDEEEEAPAPKRRTRSKAKATPAKKAPAKKGKGGPAAGRTTKEVTGGVGTAELAEAASEIADMEIDGRDVRVYLRQNEVEKDPEHGRYHWPSEKNKEFVRLAKAIAKHYED